MSSYKLSLNSVRSINRTIVAVNQMRKTGVVGDLPFRQNQKRQPAGATLQIGKTTAAWAKGTEATVDLYKTSERTQILDEDDNPVLSGTIFNLFADVGADKWVAFMNGILIAAECDEE